MRQGEGEAISTVEQAIDLISVVKEIHGLNSQELNKLLRDSENFTIHFVTEKGLDVKIDVEKLAGFLPLHLIAVLVSSDRDEALLRYLLCGIRILHTLCELAPHHTKLEQVDVFSFGIALWEILTGEEPYASMHCGAIIGGIVNNTLRPRIPERCDPEWRKLMEECWLFEPACRPSFTEITNRLRQMSVALQPKQRTPIR